MFQIDAITIAPSLFRLACFLAVMALSISKSGFGGAIGSLSMPIMLFVLPPKPALGVLLPLFLPLFLITDVRVVYLWRQWMNRRFALIMCGFGTLGTLTGWLLFDCFNDRALTLLIGVVGMVTAVNYGRKVLLPNGETSKDAADRMMARLWPRAVGWRGLSGLAGFVSLSGGIPAQVFLPPRALARQAFVGTMSIYFFVISPAKLPFYGDPGLFTDDTMKISAWLLPVIPLGVYVGRTLNRIMSDRLFCHISHSVLFAMSAKLLYDAAAG